MVAATSNALTAINASAKPVAGATGASSANAANGATANGNVADGENAFTQLINSLLADDTSSTGSATPTTDAPDKDAKSTETANNDSDATPTWLLAPYATLPMPANPMAGAAKNGSDDDSIGALSAFGKGGANNNALLAQSLTQMLNGKSNQVDASADKQITDGNAASSLVKNGGENSLAGLLNKSIQSATTDNSALLQVNGADQKPEKKDAGGANGVDQLQSVATFQAALADTKAAAPATQYQLHAAVGSHEWAAELGNKLSMMVGNKVQSASLQLSPENMGPVHVKIDISQNQTSVWFTADHADTRTALEQSLPRLRELFAAQGMSLTDAGVFGQQSQQQAALSSNGNQAAFGMTDISNEPTVTQQVIKIGLLDTYA